MSGIDKWADDMLRTPSLTPTPQELLEERTHVEIRCRAIRVVAAQSVDAAECRELLAALGFTTSDIRSARDAQPRGKRRRKTSAVKATAA